MAVAARPRERDLRVVAAAIGLSALAGVAGLAALTASRRSTTEVVHGVGTIGSP